MAARVAVIPAPFNTASAVSVFPLYATVGAAGVDAIGAGGAAFAAVWPGTISGVLIPNQGNGAVWLYYTCGATAGGVYQVLIGNVAGNTGQVPPATAETGTIAASTSGWLGPWSPYAYNQEAPTSVTYSGPPINATALTAAAQGCVVIDFTATTSLCARAYQNSVVTP